MKISSIANKKMQLLLQFTNGKRFFEGSDLNGPLLVVLPLDSLKGRIWQVR